MKDIISKIKRPSASNIINLLPDSPLLYDSKVFGITRKNLLGDNVKIAIISTGLPYHKDFDNIDDFETFDDSLSPNDEHGNSTMVAGIIGANNDVDGICGIAPKSSIYIAKALSNSGQGNLNSINASILWAIVKEVDIILLPFEFIYNPIKLHNTIKKANEENICIFAPIGQRSYHNTIFPESFPEVMGVSNFPNKFSETLCYKIPKDSYTTYGEKQYIKTSGVNMASAIAAGLAALTINKFNSENKLYTVQDVYRQLLKTNN